MRYEGKVIRPPSEASSYILQVTLGCSHNKCTFCGTFKEKPFQIRPLSEVFEDLNIAKSYYKQIDKIFLADGDALVLKTDHLLQILSKIKELFPKCKRVGIYGRAKDILRKTDSELTKLKENGLGIIYMGAESGNDEILELINKGETKQEMIEAVNKSEAIGIPTSVTFINGIGGKKLWKQNAMDSGRLISLMQPSYVSLLTLMVESNTPISKDIKDGIFSQLKPTEILAETKLMIENINTTKEVIFRSNHASNYVSLKGTFPQDKQKLLKEITYAQQNNIIKPESYRGL